MSVVSALDRALRVDALLEGQITREGSRGGEKRAREEKRLCCDMANPQTSPPCPAPAKCGVRRLFRRVAPEEFLEVSPETVR